MFIGRKKELQKLQDYYDADYPKTCAIYGRRRVGKTSLVQEFCKDKKLLKLDLGGKVKNAVLDDLSRSISDFDGRDFDALPCPLRNSTKSSILGGDIFTWEDSSLMS